MKISYILTAASLDDERDPCILIEIALTAVTLRLAVSPVDIVFPTATGETYRAWNITLGDLEQQAGTHIERLKLKVDNANRVFGAFVLAEDFTGKPMRVIRIMRGNAAGASYFDELFYGTLEQPKFSGAWVELSATQGKAKYYAGLTRLYSVACPRAFGDTQCNHDALADTTPVTGTAAGGSVITLTDPALTGTTDAWAYGLVTLTRAGYPTEVRQVDSYDDATHTLAWSIPLAFAVDGRTTYSLVRGCDKTWETCGGGSAWGPTGDNSLNYGGFLHINKSLIGESSS